ncbi:hypothetical protein HYT57_00455 [Candidatus Woesearchaeota archaeon]|nr:hypothetical protein [Candidatus Woesearchaeota archaeon]
MIKNEYLNDLSFLLTKWPIGLLPGKVQERVARKYGRDKCSYFNAELIVSTCVSLLVYGSGQLMENPSYNLLNYIDEAATTYVLIGRMLPVSGRYIASRILKRPVGSCIVEGANILFEQSKEDLEWIAAVSIADKMRNIA